MTKNGNERIAMMSDQLEAQTFISRKHLELICTTGVQSPADALYGFYGPEEI